MRKKVRKMAAKIEKDFNYRLVGYVILKFFNYSHEYLNRIGLSSKDLYQQGNLGLVAAYKNYNPEYGTKFSTWACQSIKNYIQKIIKSARKNTALPLFEDIIDYKSIDNVEIMIDFENCCKRLLSKENADLIYEHIFEGFTFREIAGKRNTSIMKVYRSYKKSIEIISKQLSF